MVKSFRAYNSHRTMLWYGYDSYSFALQHISRYISMNTICYMETINIVRVYSCLGVHIVFMLYKNAFSRGTITSTISWITINYGYEMRWSYHIYLAYLVDWIEKDIKCFITWTIFKTNFMLLRKFIHNTN